MAYCQFIWNRGSLKFYVMSCWTLNNSCTTSFAVGRCCGFVVWHLVITLSSLLFTKPLPSTLSSSFFMTAGILQISIFSSVFGTESESDNPLCSGENHEFDSFALLWLHNIPSVSAKSGVLSRSFTTKWKSSVIKYWESALTMLAVSHITIAPTGLLCR